MESDAAAVVGGIAHDPITRTGIGMVLALVFAVLTRMLPVGKACGVFGFAGGVFAQPPTISVTDTRIRT